MCQSDADTPSADTLFPVPVQRLSHIPSKSRPHSLMFFMSWAVFDVSNIVLTFHVPILTSCFGKKGRHRHTAFSRRAFSCMLQVALGRLSFFSPVFLATCFRFGNIFCLTWRVVSPTHNHKMHCCGAVSVSVLGRVLTSPYRFIAQRRSLDA